VCLAAVVASVVASEFDDDKYDADVLEYVPAEILTPEFCLKVCLAVCEARENKANGG
jgi:hypothetical protein